MRQGFTVHHNGPPADCIVNGVVQPHTRCEAFWRSVKNFHVNVKGWSDIAYSFGVCPHGERFVGRGWVKHQFANGDDEVGPDDDENGPWYSVLMFVGGGPGTGDPEEIPPKAMDDGLDRLITEGRTSGRCGMRVKPHSDWKRKPCPGPHYTAYCRRNDNRPITIATKEWDEMATKQDLEDVIKDLFKDEPGGDSGYATGQIVARLTREMKAPSSPFRQAVVKAVTEDIKSLLGQERLELIVASGVNGAAGDTTDGEHGLGARLDDVGAKLGDLLTRS